MEEARLRKELEDSKQGLTKNEDKGVRERKNLRAKAKEKYNQEKSIMEDWALVSFIF